MKATQAGVVLDALQQRSSVLFGDGAARLEPVAIFDRPYSTVMRLRVVTPESAPSFAFMKIYKARPVRPYETPPLPADVVREEFAATSRLHETLAGRPGLSSPRPIAAFPEHGAIVTQELVGQPLDRVLHGWRRRRRVPTPEAIATRIAAWLRTFQRSAPARGVWSITEARAYLDDRLRYLARFLGEPARARCLAIFDRIAADFPTAPEPMVPIHADLCPANIMVTPGGGVAVLDFATAQTGTRYHDMAHLYLHLDLARVSARRRGVDLAPMMSALLASFDGIETMRRPLFHLMLLQHVVCHVTHVADSAGWGPRLARETLARWRWRSLLGALDRGTRQGNPTERRLLMGGTSVGWV